MQFLLLSLIILTFMAGCQTSAPKHGQELGRLLEFHYRYSTFRYRPFVYRLWREKEEGGKERVFFQAQGYKEGIFDIEKEVSGQVLLDLNRIMEEEDILSWDGFRQTDKKIRDGFSFDFRADFEGRKLSASGYARRPKNFRSGHQRLSAYLLDLALSLDRDRPMAADGLPANSQAPIDPGNPLDNPSG